MPLRKGIAAVLFVLMFATIAPVQAMAEMTEATKVSAAKVDQLTKSSSYSFVKKTDIVWYAVCNRDDLKNFKVIVTVQDDLMVAFVTVIQKRQIPMSLSFIQKVLNYNNSLDFVKVGLDKDGDMFVRIDSNVRTMDDRSFKEMIDQVAAASNEIYRDVKPDLLQ